MAGERRTPAVVIRATGVHGDLSVSKTSKKKGGPAAHVSNQKDDLGVLDISDRWLSFTYEDNAKLVDKMSLTLRNEDLALLDDPHFRLGSELEVAWGYADELSEPRKVIITALDGFTTLTVEGLAETIKMDRASKGGRRFDNATRSTVVRKIADEYGFGTDADIEDTKVVLASITQRASQTDAEFIAELARKERFEFYVRKSGMVFKRKNLAQDPVAEFTYYQNAPDNDLMSLTYREDTKGKKGAVTAKGRDPIAKKDIEGKAANDSTAGRPSLGSKMSLYAEAVDQRTGQTQQRYAAPPAKDAVRSSSERTEAAAQRDAESDFLDEQHGAIKLKFQIIGNPKVSARKVVRILGIGKRLSGPYYIDKATHKLDNGSGYTIPVESTRDTHNGYGDAKKDVTSEGVANTKGVKAPVTVTAEQVNQKTGETRTVYRTQQ